MTGGYRSPLPLLLAVVFAVASGGWGASAARQATPAADCRVVAHELGEACVPLVPRRVVVLDPFVALPTLIDLGVPIAGAGAIAGFGDPLPAFLQPEEVEGIDLVGPYQEPDLERIAALRPDLIIGDSLFVEPLYDRLSQVAPTVPTAVSSFGNNDAWKSDVRAVAGLVGKREQIDERIAAYEARAEEFRAALADRTGALEVTVVGIAAGELAALKRCTWPGAVLAEAGLVRPPEQRSEDCSRSPLHRIPLELIPDLDADAIFYYEVGSVASEEDIRATADRFLSNPLWGRLDAVRNGQAFRVEQPVWGLGGSVRAANLVLDDLERYLLGEGA